MRRDSCSIKAARSFVVEQGTPSLQKVMGNFSYLIWDDIFRGLLQVLYEITCNLFYVYSVEKQGKQCPEIGL